MSDTFLPGLTEMNRPPDVSIVVPVYRSAGSLSELVGRIAAVLASLQRESELILVDDGSPDGSWDEICSLRQAYPEFVVAIRLMRNFGQHNALMCGCRHARGDIVITMDDDLQNPPEEIPKILKAIECTEVDAAYGVPGKRQCPGWRNCGSYFIQLFIQKALGVPGPVSAFRAMRRPVIDAILRYDLNYTFIDGLIAWNTQRVSYVTVQHHARANGRSGYSLRRLLLHAVNIVTNFSLLPLQVATAVGLLAAIGGLGAGVYYLVQAMLNNIAVPGYASIIVAVMTLGGLQLLALGIIGEYIGRVHLNINKKPQYTVREVIGPTAAIEPQTASELQRNRPLESYSAEDEQTTSRSEPAVPQKG